MSRRATGLVLVVLAALVVAGLLPTGGAQEEELLTHKAVVLAGTGADPVELGRAGLDWVPRNASFDAEIRFRTREPVDDTLEIAVHNGTANRTRVHVNSSASEAVVVPVSVRGIQAGDHREALIRAVFPNLTHDGDKVGGIGAQLTVVPQPRALLLSPPNHPKEGGEGEARVPEETRETNRLVADWDEEVTIRARLENPWPVPTGSLPIQARHGGRAVAHTEVASLAPGEARNVTVGSLAREDVERSRFGVASRAGETRVLGTVSLAVGPDGGGGDASERAPDAQRPLYNYTWPGPTLHDQQRARGAVEFRRGVAIADAKANLTLGEPSDVTVEVRHHGGSPARPAEVDLHVHPLPDLAYGVDSTVRRSITARLAPGESRFVNVTFTPQVGAPHRLEATIGLGGDEARSRQRIALENPVDFRVVGGTTRTLTKGDTVEAAVEVQSPEGLDGRLGWAATVEEARTGETGAPFSSLVTKDDLAEVTYDREEVTGGPAATNVSVQARGLVAGDVAVVPTLRADGVVYPGAAGEARLGQIFNVGAVVDGTVDGRRRDQVAGVLGLRVQPAGSPVPTTIVPPALVLLGVVGVEAHRRWFVR